MRKRIFLWVLFCWPGFVFAQGTDPDLLAVKQRMDSIEAFSANLRLEVDIDFVNMPVKHAKVRYEKGRPIQFAADDFVLVPKRGLDFSLGRLFETPFVTVEMPPEMQNGRSLKVLKLIPTDKKADYSIATLWLDVENRRLAQSTIHTVKDGAYTVVMTYANEAATLPEKVEVRFEMEKFKIPMKYMGKAEIDTEKMKADGPKTGRIFLFFEAYEIEYSE